MPSPIVEALAALRDAFGRLGVRWYLFEAPAALLYGAARLTADADVTVDPGPRARIVTLEGIPIPVASPEDLVTMKVLAGRPKDLDDAEAIVAANAGRLDETLVRTTLATLERALDRSDLVPAFDALSARARS